MAGRNRHVLLAMGVAFVAAMIAMAVNGIVPFGGKYIMGADWNSQYYPYLLQFRRYVLSGTLPAWDWTGGGTNYVAAAAYYLVTPWNLLACAIPESWLPGFMSFSLAAHAALAAGAMAWCLGRMYGNAGVMAAVAGYCFGTCGFMAGYFWNIIWMDAFAATPLVVYGTYELLSRGKFKLYVLSLAFSLATNFYMGFFTCVFVLLVFIGYHVIAWDGWRGFGRRLVRIAAMSAIAIGMCCVLLLPAYLALRDTYAVDAGLSDLSGFWPYERVALREFLFDLGINMSGLMNFTEPTILKDTGLPNIFCGTAAFAGWLLFLTDKRISRKERGFSLGLVGFMVLSFSVRALTYVWHGFHYPNSIPHRFAYLVGFVMIAGAFRETIMPEAATRPRKRAMSFGFVLIALVGLMSVGAGVLSGVAWTCGAVALFLVDMSVDLFVGGSFKRRNLCVAMAVLCLVQGCVGLARGYSYVEVMNDGIREGEYPHKQGQVESLLAMEEPYGSGYWRSSVMDVLGLNNAYLYGYDGGSQFTSMVRTGTVGFYRAIGAHGMIERNRHACDQFNPVSDAVLGIRYRIAKDGLSYEPYGWSEVGTDGDSILFENDRALPFGFMADGGLADWDSLWDMPARVMFDTVPDEDGDLVEESPFERQSEFFSALTGMDLDLWDPVEPSGFKCLSGDDCVRQLAYGIYDYGYCAAASDSITSWDFDVPEDGYYAVYMSSSLSKGFGVKVNGELYDYQALLYQMAPLGNLKKGDHVEMRASSDKQDFSGSGDGFDDDKIRGVRVYLEKFDPEAFEAGYEALASRPGLEISSRAGGHLAGSIDAGDGGLLFLAIPCAEGWSAEVDGESAEIVKVGNGMIGLELGPGGHGIGLVYRTPGLTVGLAVSGLSLAAFAAACWLSRKKGRGDAPERVADGIGGDTGVQRVEDHQGDG